MVAARPRTAGRVTLNHVIVYVRDVERSLRFYRDRLGFRTIEAMPGYARLRSPLGGATIALHASPARRPSTGTRPVVLYFEAPDLERLCQRLRRGGVRFEQLPRRMPWGWEHAYLRDPDGHSISLYRAGRKRFRPTPRTRES
jgi:catechol 2,3-dioxygenase-like lactoylglutathione lyase family enzyme